MGRCAVHLLLEINIAPIRFDRNKLYFVVQSSPEYAASFHDGETMRSIYSIGRPMYKLDSTANV